MKVKAFVNNNLRDLEWGINEFLEDEDYMLLDVKFSASKAYNSNDDDMDFTYSALIIYEEGICNE